MPSSTPLNSPDELIAAAEAEIGSSPLLTGRVSWFSSKSPFRESPNQDGALVLGINATSAVVAVADGVGGLPAGDQAARLALDAVRDRFEDQTDASLSMRPSILDGIEQANQRVMGMNIGAGTTIAVAEIFENHVRPYHVGDSLILITGQRGKRRLLTIAHAPVAYAVEAGLVSELDAMHHEERHLVSNILGMEKMRIDVGSTIKLQVRDTLLLATDGLFDNLHLEEIVEIIRKGPLDEATEELATQAQRRMKTRVKLDDPQKPDDLTFVMYRPTA